MPLHVHQSPGTRLTAHVNDIMGIREAIESSSRAFGVGTHVFKVEPITNIKLMIEADALSDAVDAITSGAPDGVLDTLVNALGVGIGQWGVVESLATSAKDLGNGVLVVKHDAAEVAVEAIIDVRHVAGLAGGGVHDGTARNDVASNGESSGDVVSAGLCNDVDGGREVLVESLTEDVSHGLEGLTTETSTDIKGLQIIPESGGLLEDVSSVLDSLEEGERVRSTGTDMEADADNVQTKILSKCQ